MVPIRLVILVLFIYSCQDQTDTVSVTRQQERVRRAETELQAEKNRLNQLRDSLEIKVQQNIELGLPEEQARSIEVALVRVQETVVAAAESNLVQQREVLALMKSTPGSPNKKPASTK